MGFFCIRLSPFSIQRELLLHSTFFILNSVNSRIFLISPATCSGLRARMLVSPAARSDLAAAIQSPQGAALGDVFTFLSGLYFRGKLAYARAFARPPRRLNRPKSGVRSPKSEVHGPTSGRPRTSDL